jgi:DNA repair exonuclease SbcCD ATPase subunit
MMHICKRALFVAVLALVAAPVLAADEPDKSSAEQILKKLDELQKSLKESREDQLNDRLKLQKALEDLAQLRKDVDALRSQSTVARKAFSPSTTSGRIQLVNVYPQQMTVIVNDTAYRLQPGEVRTLESQPAGSFAYQVLGVQTAPQSRLLAANETYTISVVPR